MPLLACLPAYQVRQVCGSIIFLPAITLGASWTARKSGETPHVLSFQRCIPNLPMDYNSRESPTAWGVTWRVQIWDDLHGSWGIHYLQQGLQDQSGSTSTHLNIMFTSARHHRHKPSSGHDSVIIGSMHDPSEGNYGAGIASGNLQPIASRVW